MDNSFVYRAYSCPPHPTREKGPGAPRPGRDGVMPETSVGTLSLGLSRSSLGPPVSFRFVEAAVTRLNDNPVQGAARYSISPYHRRLIYIPHYLPRPDSDTQRPPRRGLPILDSGFA